MLCLEPLESLEYFNNYYLMDRKATRLQKRKKKKQVHQTIKMLTGKPTLRMKSIKDKQGNVLIEEEKIKDGWRETYAELYNMPGPSETSVLQTIPSTQVDETEPVILRAEVEVALEHLKEGKAAGYHSISAEELKAAGEPCVDVKHKLCNKVWNSEYIPEDWGKAIIVPIFKKKDQSAYWGISLLILTRKVFYSILHNHMKKRTKEILLESQAGFRPGRSTVDQLFTLSQITEKYKEVQRPLYLCYIDYQKAFGKRAFGLQCNTWDTHPR